jgi:hypothetical protein
MTVEGSSPALLRELLTTFELELRKQGVPVDDWLQPGAHDSSVRAEFSARGLTAPEEAVVWFGWHDGARAVRGSEQALPMFTLRSLHHLSVEWTTPGRLQLGHGEWDWNADWVKILGEQLGVAVCCRDDPERPPLVRAITADGTEGTQDWQTAQQVVSLCTPVAWWIESLRRGWYQWDPRAEEWRRDLADQPILTSVYGLT